MTGVLIKRFVKRSEDVRDSTVRRDYGILSGFVCIACNILLFLMKIITGLATGYISITADALNNLSDMASGVVMLIGFKAVGKPADVKHPYGHGRFEYVAGQIVSFAIMFMGVNLFKESVQSIISPVQAQFNAAVIVILVISIVVKTWMWYFNRTVGKKIDSASIKATAQDSLNDCIATGSVLVCLIIEQFTGARLDGFAGAGVSIFIFISGIMACRETMEPLLGKMPTQETIDTVKKEVMADENVIGVHDIMFHDYGPGRVYCTLHAEVPANLGIIAAHGVIDEAEKRVVKALGCEVSIHMDPVEINDEETNRLKGVVAKVIRTIGPDIKLHDFRILQREPVTKISFDVVLPDDSKDDPSEIKERIKKSISMWEPHVESEIMIDRLFIHE